MEKCNRLLIFGFLVAVFFICPVLIYANENINFDLVGNERLHCIANDLTWIYAPSSDTEATIFYKIVNSYKTWYRVKLNKIPKIFSGGYNYTEAQIKTCQWNPSVEAEELNYWLEEKYIPVVVRKNILDMESFAEKTLGAESFYIDKNIIIRECPTPSCEAEWLGTWGGIATVIDQNESGEWYKVAVSNVDTRHFDTIGAEGWLYKNIVPDVAKESFHGQQKEIMPSDNQDTKKISFIDLILNQTLKNKNFILKLLLFLFLLAVIIIIFLLRKSKKIIKFKPIFLTILVILVLFGFGYGFTYYQNFNKERNKKIAEIESKYSLALAEFDKGNFDKASELLSSIPKDSSYYQDARIKMAEMEFKEALGEVKEGALKEIQKSEALARASAERNKTPDTSTIISQWRPKIAYIECEYYSNMGSGSGTVVKFSDGNIYIITNEHVLNEASKCDVSLLNGSTTFRVVNNNSSGGSNPFKVSTLGFDWGLLRIDRPDNYILNLSSSGLSKCTKGALVGDAIVILGYPAIGSQTDITATTGIISGYEDDYYITDAKIEQGNSGGAAILIKDNCYLGIPSFARVGKIESLSRILDQRVIFGQ